MGDVNIIIALLRFLPHVTLDIQCVLDDLLKTQLSKLFPFTLSPISNKELSTHM